MRTVRQAWEKHGRPVTVRELLEAEVADGVQEPSRLTEVCATRAANPTANRQGPRACYSRVRALPWSGIGSPLAALVNALEALLDHRGRRLRRPGEHRASRTLPPPLPLTLPHTPTLNPPLTLTPPLTPTLTLTLTLTLILTLHPSPFTLHPSPSTLHPSPFTLHPSPSPSP